MEKDIILAVILASIGSSGLWAFLQFLITNSKKRKKKEDMIQKLDRHEDEITLTKAMTLGVLYDRTKFLGESYIKRGWMTVDEYEDYKKYLYEPYHNAGGDGTIDRIMKELDALPITGKKKGSE